MLGYAGCGNASGFSGTRRNRTGAWKKDWLFPEKVGLKSAFSQPSPPEKG
jgi:hypothetical protein